MVAIHEDHSEIVQFLLENGADEKICNIVSCNYCNIGMPYILSTKIKKPMNATKFGDNAEAIAQIFKRQDTIDLLLLNRK